MYKIGIHFRASECKKTFTRRLTAWIDVPDGMMYRGKPADRIMEQSTLDHYANHKELSGVHDAMEDNMMRVMDKLEFLH